MFDDCFHTPTPERRAAGGLPAVPGRDQGPDRGCPDPCRTRRQQRADPALLGDRARDPRAPRPRGLGLGGDQAPLVGPPPNVPRYKGAVGDEPAPHAGFRPSVARLGGLLTSCEQTAVGTQSGARIQAPRRRHPPVVRPPSIRERVVPQRSSSSSVCLTRPRSATSSRPCSTTSSRS